MNFDIQNIISRVVWWQLKNLSWIPGTRTCKQKLERSFTRWNFENCIWKRNYSKYSSLYKTADWRGQGDSGIYVGHGLHCRTIFLLKCLYCNYLPKNFYQIFQEIKAVEPWKWLWSMTPTKFANFPRCEGKLIIFLCHEKYLD